MVASGKKKTPSSRRARRKRSSRSTSKNIDDVDLLRHVLEAFVRRLAKGFADVRVDGDDVIAVALHVLCDAETGPPRAVGKTDYGDGVGCSEQFRDLVVVHHR